MITLGNIINDVSKIRDAIDKVEIKGSGNRFLIDFAYNKCTDLINSINEAATEIQNAEKEEINAEG